MKYTINKIHCYASRFGEGTYLVLPRELFKEFERGIELNDNKTVVDVTFEVDGYPDQRVLICFYDNFVKIAEYGEVDVWHEDTLVVALGNLPL